MGGGDGRSAVTTRSGTSTHAFCRGDAHTTAANRPPGRSARSRLAKASGGSSKNITPKREKQRSKDASKDCVCASALKYRTLPGASARAAARNGSQRSIPRTLPEGPNRSASSVVVEPNPQPTSSADSPGAGASASMAARPKGASAVWSASRMPKKRGALTSFQIRFCSSFATDRPGYGFGIHSMIGSQILPADAVARHLACQPDLGLSSCVRPDPGGRSASHRSP